MRGEWGEEEKIEDENDGEVENDGEDEDEDENGDEYFSVGSVSEGTDFGQKKNWHHGFIGLWFKP